MPDYDLAATLNSGQSFRWRFENGGWSGVVGLHWVWLRASGTRIMAETAVPVSQWDWLTQYLQLSRDLDAVLRSFPDDVPLRAAVAVCRGLRLLRQDPWECLASFVLSSTKQIVQIQQVIGSVCACFGDPMPVPAGFLPAYSFPGAARLAAVGEAALRACRMGFRAPYLLKAAQEVADGKLDLLALRHLPLAEARRRLTTLAGVGSKIADCVLLFAYGFEAAFPIDVWVRKALSELYFQRRRPTPRRLQAFVETHFGPHAGYAQQYLFHYMRTRQRGKANGGRTPAPALGGAAGGLIWAASRRRLTNSHHSIDNEN